jgi:hypothetical protein
MGWHSVSKKMCKSTLCALRAVAILIALIPIAFSQDAPTSAAAAAGKTLWVTNDGADGATCGSRAKPCRSISQAIENASDGDSIGVGAGHYGNVSGNPNFGGPGDEHPGFPYIGVHGEPGLAGCIVCITKALRISSIHGAAVTVIEGSPSTPYGSNVMITHDHVVFGTKNHGFTITGGNTYGVTVAFFLGTFDVNLGHITVAGNVDVNDTNGFVFSGDYLTAFQLHGCPPDACSRSSPIVFSDNKAFGNGIGFSVVANADGGPVFLRNNLASGAGSGFVANAGTCPSCGESFSGNDTDQVTDNVAAHCGTGFSMYTVGVVDGNTASDNANAGFIIDAPFTESFRSNSAIGNGGPGVIINFSPDEFHVLTAGGGFLAFSRNNFFGNDRNRPVLSLGVLGLTELNPGPSAHCGVLNVGALAAISGPVAVTPPPIVNLQAAGNFWGSSNGPAPTGAGDAVGGACDQNGGVTNAKPFSTVTLAITSLN